jgi:hypothetical protein
VHSGFLFSISVFFLTRIFQIAGDLQKRLRGVRKS